MKGGQGRKSVTQLENKLRQLHDAVRDHKDMKTGRLICTVFMKLPSKNVSRDIIWRSFRDWSEHRALGFTRLSSSSSFLV